MRHHYGGQFYVYSAGTVPSRLNPYAVQVMAEEGIDISSHYSKSVGDYLEKTFDYVITVCDDANETCPIFTGTVVNRLHWGFEDPAGMSGSEKEILDKFREVKDLIKEKITTYFG